MSVELTWAGPIVAAMTKRTVAMYLYLVVIGSAVVGWIWLLAYGAIWAWRALTHLH
jgi:hypothetical protein